MLWYMNSKELETFINNESDDNILEAQYVIVSNRIRRVGNAHDNIIQASVLFPDSSVAVALDTDEFEEMYYKQLDENKTLLAVLINSVIINGYNIIFLCTKRESKLGNYLGLIANYVFNEFDFPMYNYMEMARGEIEEYEYDEADVYNKCKKLIDSAKDKQIIDKINNDRKMSDGNKKRLKKLLKEHDLYEKGMSLGEMMNVADVFLSDISGG